jgi:hypothetical protein
LLPSALKPPPDARRADDIYGTKAGMAQDKALAAHLAAHPEHRGAAIVLVTKMTA